MLEFVMGGLAVNILFQVAAMYTSWSSQTDETVASLRERIAVLEATARGPPGPEGPPGPPGLVSGSRNYHDELAQSICTAITNTPSFIFAIRRDCRANGDGLTCDAMCSSRLADMRLAVYGQGSTSACIDAVHVYMNRPVLAPDHETDAGKVGLATFRYFSGGCSWTANHCGPNYCCCRLLP
ncbi:PREDICTED: uncharacterized protein LOC109463632 [Branchiostoma belcheri]|uniref:Uncharacterized protein LOC109463632 n=1 Tax=Branchiostoma belcheri TaxID=7741 RepID=A0A6P4YB82_BRABE|nr:PREDICTED: uncharacterized protein LOC109463632 [Branchiostoma belcheri]